MPTAIAELDHHACIRPFPATAAESWPGATTAISDTRRVDRDMAGVNRPTSMTNPCRCQTGRTMAWSRPLSRTRNFGLKQDQIDQTKLVRGEIGRCGAASGNDAQLLWGDPTGHRRRYIGALDAPATGGDGTTTTATCGSSGAAKDITRRTSASKVVLLTRWPTCGVIEASPTKEALYRHRCAWIKLGPFYAMTGDLGRYRAYRAPL